MRRNNELLALTACGYVVGFSWIIQRDKAGALASYDFASRFLEWQSIEPMAIYGVGLVIAKTLLLVSLARNDSRLTGLVLAGLTGFWMFMAASFAAAIFDGKPLTFAGVATAIAFGFWHYFASTRSAT